MRIRVEGGQPLNGTYRPSGNTNAAIALLAAALLTDQPVTIANVPRTASTDIMVDLARWLGADLNRDPDGTVQIQSQQLSKRDMTPTETHGFVGSLLYIAPVLVRRGFVRMEVDFPLNRISTHLEALRDLGQDVVTVSGAVEIRAAQWEYRDIILTQASVTATEIALMLAAVLGKETIIRNAASEPHVQELAHMLELMGVQIEGIGSNMLHVFGTESLHGAKITVGPNYIEAASVAAMIALSGGRGQVEGIRHEDLLVIERIYHRLGINLDLDEGIVYVPRHSEFIISNREEDVDSSVKAAPWPGFPSDLIAIAAVIASQARGTSLIHEPMFDNRLLFVDKLNAMGAQVLLADPHRAIVRGPTPLFPIYMDSPDVRAGLGLLAAALLADGETVIDNAQAISRSFDAVLTKLEALGARVTTDAGVTLKS